MTRESLDLTELGMARVAVNALTADNRELRAEIERLQTENEQPHLGLATTRELLNELRARIEMHALGGLEYRTVDGEEFAREPRVTVLAVEDPKP